MHKTDKAKLLHKIEGHVDHDAPNANEINATIVDAMFLIHTLQHLPPTYGGVAQVILHLLCAMSDRIDFVCDTYHSPSIKYLERERRGSEDFTLSITGREQIRPRDWENALKSASFKTSLFKFLAIEWQNDLYAEILAGHQIFLGYEEECYSFTEMNGKVTREAVPSLRCSHEEADTRMVYHLYQILRDDASAKIGIRCNDTDVFILLLYHIAHATGSPAVWVDAGLASNNTRRYINISKLVSHLDSVPVDALPALHAFTGCDYTAAFMNKGKLKPLDLMMKSPVHTEIFSKLGNNSIIIPENILTGIEKFTCAL